MVGVGASTRTRTPARRYDNAQRILVAEVPALQSEAGAMAASLAPQRDPERVLVADLLFYLVADNDAAAAARSFDRLAAWVDASLDMYRARAAPGPAACSPGRRPPSGWRVPGTDVDLCCQLFGKECALAQRSACASGGTQLRPTSCVGTARHSTDAHLGLGYPYPKPYFWAPQAELARVLYPVFLHTYLDLVGQGAAGEAAALMARHRARFTEPGGRASKLRTQVPRPPHAARTLHRRAWRPAVCLTTCHAVTAPGSSGAVRGGTGLACELHMRVRSACDAELLRVRVWCTDPSCRCLCQV